MAAIKNLDALAADDNALAEMLDSLPPPCHTSLRALAEAGRPIDAGYARAELADALGSATADGTLARLDSVGLLVDGRHPDSHAAQLGLKPALARALRRLFDAWSERRAALVSPPRPLPFAAVALLAHLANARPRLTTRGNLYARDRDALLDRFSGLAALDLTHLYNTLLELCRLHRGQDGRLAFDASHIIRVLEASASQLTHLRHVAALQRLGDAERGMLQSLVRWGGSAQQKWLLAAARLREAASREGRRFHWGSDISGLRRVASMQLRKLVQDELVIVDGGSVHLAASLHTSLLRANSHHEEQNSSSRPGRSIVQPDLSIVVPPDEAPRRVFELGQFSQLVHFDTVATFVINQASVRRGRHEGVTREKMRAVLEEASLHPVSDNVMRAIDDLAGPDRIAQLIEGIVVYLPDLNDEEASRVGLLATNIPGAWLTQSHDRARLLRALSREGIEVSSAQRPGPTSHTAGVEEFLDRLAQILCEPSGRIPAQPHGLSAVPLSTVELESRASDSLTGPWLRAAQRLEVRPELLAMFERAWRHHPWKNHAHPDPLDILQRLDPSASRKPSARQVRSTAGMLTAVLRDCQCCQALALLGERAIDSALTLGCLLWIWPQTQEQPMSVHPHQCVERGGEAVLLCELTTTLESRAIPLMGTLIALGAPRKA